MTIVRGTQRFIAAALGASLLACSESTVDLQPGLQADAGSANPDADTRDAGPPVQIEDAGRVDAAGPVEDDAGRPADAGGASDAGSPLDVEAALVAAECARAARCLRALFFPTFDSEATCVAAGGFGMGRRTRSLLEAGRARLRPGALAGCVAALETAGCTDVDPSLECDRILEGTVPLGGTCVTSEGCGPGLRCRAERGCGVCVEAIPNGGSCDTLTRNACASGVCFTPVAGTPAVCVPTGRGPGEACAGNYSECREPLACWRGVDGNRSCVSLRQPGDSCSPPFETSPPCDFLLSRGCIEGRCAPLEFVRAGETCDPARRCSAGTCRMGRCEPLPELGQPCAPGSCAAGLGRCGAEGRCVAYSGEDEACATSTECAPGLACEGQPPRCTSRPWEHCD